MFFVSSESSFYLIQEFSVNGVTNEILILFEKSCTQKTSSKLFSASSSVRHYGRALIYILKPIFWGAYSIIRLLNNGVIWKSRVDWSRKIVADTWSLSWIVLVLDHSTTSGSFGDLVTQPYKGGRCLCPWDLQARVLEWACHFSRKNISEWAGHFFSEGIFPTQDNPGLPHCRRWI